MSAPPLKGKVLTCRNKVRHPCELTARAAAMDAIARYHNVARLSVYQCPECRGWHLTKKPTRLMVTEDDPIVKVK